jgi:acetyl-CoA carboxylase biotin carboxyl carrier protein
LSLSKEDIRSLIRIFDDSDWQEMKIRIGDFRLTLSKSSPSVLSLSERMPPSHESPPIPASSALTMLAKSPESEDLKNDNNLPQPGQQIIRAPHLGTFWSRPKPDAPSFVKVGDIVHPESTVCVLEVMKLFTQVKAGVNGRIVKICATDGSMVEHETPLFIVGAD